MNEAIVIMNSKATAIKIQLKILDKRIGQQFCLPTYATEGSAGLDLVACIDSPLRLNPGQSELVSTGLSIYLQDPNYVALVVPRSGLGVKHGIVLGNLIGVIDADYQGPIKVSLWNRGEHAFGIQPGDRVAQLLITPRLKADFQLVDDFSEPSQRGHSGFGHSGISKKLNEPLA